MTMVRKISPNQMRVLAERCSQAKVKPHDVTQYLFGKPPASLTGDEASDAIRLLVDALASGTDRRSDPWEAFLEFANADSEAESDEPTGDTDEPGGKLRLRALADGESWTDWAADLLGLVEEREEECSHCGGTGTRMVGRRATKGLVVKTMGNYGSSTGVMPSSKFAVWLENPRLESLRHVAGLLDASLEDTVRFCARLAKHIRRELDQ